MATTPNASPTTSYDTFYNSLPEAQRALIDSHISGLKNALDSEKTRRRSLTDEIQTLQESQTGKLDALTAEHEQALAARDLQLRFYEGAQQARCTAPKLAWLAAQDSGHIAEDGSIDWNGLTETYPVLFAQAQGPAAPPPANSQAGSNHQPNQNVDMNAAIRAATGRQ